MAEPKLKPTGEDVDAFLDSVESPERRADARTLAKLMADLTGEAPLLWASSIVGFGQYSYRYASGHEGVAPLAAFAPRKANLVVYLISGFEERHHRLLERLGPYKAGKGCLYLKRLEDVDLDVLAALIHRSNDVARGIDRASSSAAGAVE